jgi:DNA-binding NarL/FixJ family response regulator
MSSILLVEDDAALAAAVARALEKARGFTVRTIGTVAGALGDRAPADLAIVDLGLPDGDGATVIGALRARGIRSVAFTIFDDRDHVLASVRAGAVGYLLKEEPIDRLLVQLDECLDGATPVSSRVARHLFELVRAEESDVELTGREEDLLVCLRRGETYEECATSLGVRIGTVQTHVKKLYRKLDVTTKAEAAAWATRHRRA